MKKVFYSIVVIAIIVIVGFLFYKSGQGKTTNSTNSSSINTSAGSDDTIVENPIATLYYGKDCPHCKDLEKWLESEKIAEKVKFNKKEVWYNKTNSAELTKKANICGIKSDEIGVPFLFDDAASKCFVGNDEIQNYFNAK